MPTAELDGVSLYYEKAGYGQAVLFSHGIPTDYRAWNAQVSGLTGAYSTIAYSRRYAHPNKREGDASDSTIEANAEDLARLIKSLGVAPVHLVGHSYGGFISGYLASEHPELVKSLVLVEPAMATLLIEDPTSSGQLFTLLLGSPGVALSARRFQSGSLEPSLKALDSGQPEKAVKLNVDGVQNKLGAFGELPQAAQEMMLENAVTIRELKTRLPPFRAGAAKISCKTLVVNGENTSAWLARTGELASKTIPHAQHVIVGNSRHFPHLENPTEFNSKLVEFLTKKD